MNFIPLTKILMHAVIVPQEERNSRITEGGGIFTKVVLAYTFLLRLFMKFVRAAVLKLTASLVKQLECQSAKIKLQ